jgi:ketosteroid isomerase-like protein
VEAEKASVKKVVNQFDEALKTENMDLLSDIFSHDSKMIIFGTDEPERWVGFEAFKDAVQKQFDRVDTREVTIRNRVVTVHESGQVAWFSKTMDWEVKVEDKVFKADDLRYTGVLAKQDGKWVFVQLHASVPVEGQLVEY